MRIEPHLARRAANHQPLTPLSFLDRALAVCPDRPAVRWRLRSYSYGEFGELVLRMADALEDWRVGASDVVAVMAPNRFEMLAAHFAVPVLGAVINALNPRLDVDAVTYILKHSEARVILADMSCAEKAQSAAAAAGIKCVVLASQTGTGIRRSERSACSTKAAFGQREG